MRRWVPVDVEPFARPDRIVRKDERLQGFPDRPAVVPRIRVPNDRAQHTASVSRAPCAVVNPPRPGHVPSSPTAVNIPAIELPPEIAERRIRSSEIPRIRDWIDRTRALAAEGLVRPDIGELAELLAAVALGGTRARRGERSWDVRLPEGHEYVQVKAVWRLPHRRRQHLGAIAQDFMGDIWVVEFARDLSVQRVRSLPGARFAGKRLRVRDAGSGTLVKGWQSAARQLGLLAQDAAR